MMIIQMTSNFPRLAMPIGIGSGRSSFMYRLCYHDVRCSYKLVQQAPKNCRLIVNGSGVHRALTNQQGSTKHINIRYHHLKENIEKGVTDLKFIGTPGITANNLTKAVFGDKHQLCTQKTGLVSHASIFCLNFFLFFGYNVFVAY